MTIHIHAKHVKALVICFGGEGVERGKGDHIQRTELCLGEGWCLWYSVSVEEMNGLQADNVLSKDVATGTGHNQFFDS